MGNIANAALADLGEHPDIPKFEIFSEVIQDSVIELMKTEKVHFTSGCSLTVTPTVLKNIYENLDLVNILNSKLEIQK